MRVAVVGGGLAGLTCARALVAAGIDARVFEASARCGGVIETSRDGGFVREHAASSFLGGPPRGALALCEALGVPVEPANGAAKQRWVFIDGKLRALPRGPLELATSDLLTWRGKLALLREPLAPRRRPGEDESVHAFAARRFGPEAARALFAPLVTGVYAADAHGVSLEAGFPRFAALDDAGGIVRGSVKQMAGALIARVRGTASARTARGLYAPTGGVGAVIDALAAELGARVELDAGVREVAAVDGGVVVDGERWDACVLATPAHAAAAIVATTIPELATRLQPLVRAPVAVVYLGFPVASVPTGALDGFGFLTAQGEDLRVLGVVFESTIWKGRAPAGHVLLRCIFGGARDPEACALTDEELVAVARRDVEEALDVGGHGGAGGGEVSHASVVRVKEGIAQYAVGHRDVVRTAAAVARGRRIVLAGADYRGLAVNEVCAAAEEVVGEVMVWR